MTSEPWQGYSDYEPGAAADGTAAADAASAQRYEPVLLVRRNPLAAPQSAVVDFISIEFQLN
ncbi:hypothetical protein ACSBOX_12025 [Arthrobacter sp. KN11-1C]|uniref:hypothetical protein n=1 Tax=Arthrobacter sp. KN11-1C TaxID=3445774 RepID=UPI003FA12C00